MKFGIDSLLFNDVFTLESIPILEKCQKLGFDFVEIVPLDLKLFPAKEVAQACKDLDMDVFIGYGLGPEHNLISPDPAVRKKGVEFSKHLIDVCNEANASALSGMIHCTWGYLSGKMRTEEEWKWGVENFREVAEYAKNIRPQMKLNIEVVNRFETHFINTASDAVRFVNEVGMDNVFVHLDTFHMIREEDNFRDAVLVTEGRIGHVHACENQRGIPGTGLVPWFEFFTALKDVGYDGSLAVESFDPDMESIAKLCCIWRKLADSPEDLATEGLKFVKDVYSQVYTT